MLNSARKEDPTARDGAGGSVHAVPIAGGLESGRTLREQINRLVASILERKGFSDEGKLNSAQKGKRALIVETAKFAEGHLRGRTRENGEPEILHSLRMAEELAGLKARTWLIAATMAHSLHHAPEELSHLESFMPGGWFTPLERTVLLLNKPYKTNGEWIYPCVVEDGAYVKNERYFEMLGRKRKDVSEVERNEAHAAALFRAWSEGEHAPVIIKLMNSLDNLRRLAEIGDDGRRREIIMEALPYVQVARVLNWDLFTELRRAVLNYRHLLENDENGRAVLSSLKDRSYEQFKEAGCIMLSPRERVRLEELPDAVCPIPILFCGEGESAKEIELKTAYLNGAGQNGEGQTAMLAQLAGLLEPVIGDSSRKIAVVESMLPIPSWAGEFLIISVFDSSGSIETYRTALKTLFEQHFKAVCMLEQPGQS